MTVPGLRRALAALVGDVPDSLRAVPRMTPGERAEVAVPVFYSALERFIENSPTARAPVSQWRGMIQNAPGIKAEEIDAVTGGNPDAWWRHVAFGEGLNDVGDPEVVGRHRITREAILNALRRDRVGLDERVAGGPPGAEVNNEGSYGRTREEVERQIEEDYMDAIDEDARERTDSSFHYDYTSPRDEWEVIPHHPQDPPPRLIPRDDETGDLFSREDGDGVAPWNGYGYDPELPAPDERQLQYWIAQQFRRNNLARNRQRAPDHTPMVAAAQDRRPPVGEADLHAPYRGLYDRAPEYEYGLPSEDSEFPGAYWWDGMAGADGATYDRYQAITGARGLSHPQMRRRLQENAFGPFRTREEAEAAMDELEQVHRDAARDLYHESDAYHQNWSDVRDEYVNRYLGEDGYEYDDMDGGAVGVKWSNFSVAGKGKGGTNYGEMVIRMPKNPLGGDFQSSHWNDENALAHVRFHDRTYDGKRTLFIEEMQSDWHQLGREGGYRDDAAQARAASALNAAGDELDAYFFNNSLGRGDASLAQRESDVAALMALPNPTEAQRAILSDVVPIFERVRDARAAYRRASGGMVENAPFKNNSWAELSMKRMIRWAADHGYDQIAWSGRIKNGNIATGDDLPDGHEFYDKILNNITNGIVKKSGGRVKRVNMGFSLPGDVEGKVVVAGQPVGLKRLLNGLVEQIISVDDVPESLREPAREALEVVRLGKAWREQNPGQDFPPELRARSEAATTAVNEAFDALTAVQPPRTDANVLELTSELKRKAQREGFPLYILPALMGGGAEAIRRMLAEDREERA